MKHTDFTPEHDGFHGVWYPCSTNTDKGIILMLGDSSDDYMAKCGAKWAHDHGMHALNMSPAKKDYGHHNDPLERFEYAIRYMKGQGCTKIAIAGASTTGMLALTAASYYSDITLTIAVSPSDFIMEGFYQDGKDGAHERPGDSESSLSLHGQPLPYLPYAYRHPEYWQRLKEEAKEGGDMVASRKMFDESERRHPITEDETIKIEQIRGRVICIGAEDDVLWDTCRYISRMETRLKTRPHSCLFEGWTYQHGTHLLFPESLMKKILPVGSKFLVSLMFKAGKQYPEECRQARIDLDRRLEEVLKEW